MAVAFGDNLSVQDFLLERLTPGFEVEELDLQLLLRVLLLAHARDQGRGFWARLFG